MSSLVLASLILAAPGPKDKSSTPEPYGLWELERAEGGSGKAKPRKGSLRYQYNRDRTWVVLEGEKEVVGARPFKFDPRPIRRRSTVSATNATRTPMCWGSTRSNSRR